MKSLLLVAAALPWGYAKAADWSISEQLAVTGTYTDNLFLTDSDPEADFFTEITPGIVVTGKGRGLNLNLAYSPQYLHYMNSDAGDELNQRLQANAQAELYQDHLFLDANVTAFQDLIDPLEPSGVDATSPNGNTQTTSTYNIAPSYRTRFGRQAELTIGFENNGVLYSKEGDDSIGYNTQIELRSGPAFNSLQWGLNAENETVDYQDGPATSFNTVMGNLGHQFNRIWRVDVSAGYEDNDYTSSSDKTRGPIFEGSATWTPSVRTSVQLGAGWRYFGVTPLLNFSHRSKRSVWTATYSRDISSARDDRTQFDVYAFEDAFGQPITPATGEALDLPVGEAAPNSSTYVSNNFSAAYSLQTRRSTLGITLGYVLRQYQDSDQDEETAQASISWSRRLTGLTSANLGLGWNRTDSQNTNEGSDSDGSDDFNISAGLSRQLSARTSLNLQYRYYDSDDAKENRLILGLQTTWSD